MTSRPVRSCPPARAARGLSLIELMVGLVVALVISLIMYNVFIVTENQRRTTGAGSDAQQSGTFSTFALERWVRMGGAGVSQIPGAIGCTLSLSSGATTRIPLPSTLPAPFDGLGLGTLRTTPVLIVNGSSTDDDDAQSTAPDALMVIGGTHRSINTFIDVSGTTTATSVPVVNSVGLTRGDLLLAVERDTASANFGDCTVAQADSVIETNAAAANVLQTQDNLGRTITLGGTYTASTGFAPGGVGYTSVADVANLGTAPVMRLFALGPEATEAGGSELRSYNMLDTTVESIADGVVNLQAVYGISASPDTDAVTDWVTPTGDYSAATLMDGSAVSQTRLQTIRAVRLVVITRSALRERVAEGDDPPTVAEWTAFADDEDLTLTGTRDDEQRTYRYRQFDFIVPLRNALLTN